MNAYYSREIDLSLKDHGNTAVAVIHWFDGDEIWPYDEWEETVTVSDIKMMSEKDVEEAVKKELLAIDNKLNANELYFKWR
jgi:hypothetical protein